MIGERIRDCVLDGGGFCSVGRMDLELVCWQASVSLSASL